MTAQLVFPTADPVTAAFPTLDGFIGHTVEDEDGVLTSDPEETGYDLGGRVSFDGGVNRPAVVVRTVKSRTDDYIYLGFFVRFAQFFSPDDVIILSMRPASVAGHDSSTRRLDIFPVWDQTASGYGAEEADPNDSSQPFQVPPASPNPMHPDWGHDSTLVARPGVANAAAYWHVRSGRQPQNIAYWQGGTPVGGNTPWSQIGTLPSGVDVRVRSSEPEPNATPPQCAWSVEVKLPIHPGADWIDLSAGFKVFFDVARIESTGVTPDLEGDYTTQFIWGSSGAPALLTGNIASSTFHIDPTWYGDAIIPPAGTNPAVGVRFMASNTQPTPGVQVVGVRDAGAVDWAVLGSQIHAATGVNRIVAQVENTEPGSTASQVRARFLFAQWGIPGPTLDWVDIENQGAVEATGRNPHDVVNGTPEELCTDWNHSQVPSDYVNYNGGHHCVMAVLESSHSVNFAQDSYRQNMDFVNLSKLERDVTISAVGHPAPPGGRPYQKFVLLTSVRSIHQAYRDESTAVLTREGALLDRIVGWEYIVHGFRDSGDKLTINGRHYATLVPAGAYGYMTAHDVKDDELSHRLELASGNDPAARISTVDHRAYGVRVPVDGKTVLQNVLETVPAGTGTPGGGGKQDPWWLRFLNWLIALIKKIFGK
jgi:hypothetical protein